MFDQIDRVSVINLPYRRDRRREMQSQLDRVCAKNVVWFDAIRPEAADGFPTVGARGCFMSHLSVIRQAATDRLSHLTILEDDFDFSELAVDQYPEILGALQSDRRSWGMLYGAYEGTTVEPAYQSFGEVPAEVQLQTSSFITLNGWVLQPLAEYLGQMLERPPGSPNGGPMHVDGAYSWFRASHEDCRTFAATPPLGRQRSSRTDIHELRWFDRLPIFRDMAQMLRGVRH